MILEWMGEYRSIIEALIHYCNIYSATLKTENISMMGVDFSYAQLQVLEYLLENEERHDNMSEVASRLGISRSNFTKMVNRLKEKGLVEKKYVPGSKKEITVTVNDFGRRVYSKYSEEILRSHYQFMFDALNKIPKEYIGMLCDALMDPFILNNEILKIRSE